MEILGTPLTEIDIGAQGAREIIQNVKTILSTWRGEVFLDRDFGIDPAIIDAPASVAQARMIADVTLQIEKQEPRFRVTGVELNQSDASDGKFIPRVTGHIREGVLV
jgi:phage baseplate assembly protein W